MRIVYGLRESMAVLLYGEPCTLTFWREGRLHRYKGFRYKDIAHFPGLRYSVVPTEYWIERRNRRVA
jgi:hypothetical protein